MKKLTEIIESVLLISDKPVRIKDLAERLSVTEIEISKAADALKKKYSGDCGIHIMIFNNKLQFSTNPEYSAQVENIMNRIRERELSRTLLETLAIIAYKQPVTRLDIESIRGVDSEYAVQALLKQNLIEITGRKESIGRPALLGTTDDFLKRFELGSLTSLPDYSVLLDKIKQLRVGESGNLYHKEEYKPENDKEDRVKKSG